MINIQAPINNLSYGIVSQHILDNLGVDFALRPIGQMDPKYKKYNRNINNFFLDDRLDLRAPSLKIFHEHSLFDHVGKGLRIGFPIFEKDKFNLNERFNIKHQDMVLVCSKWAAEIVKPINPNVMICPLGVDEDFFVDKQKNKSGKVIFYNQGKREIRKGHDRLHHIFKKAFDHIEDVELWMFSHNEFDSQEESLSFKREYKSVLRDKVKFFPKLPKQEMINWISKTDCGIFPFRSEGWCFSKDTEILTNNGLKTINNVNIGDIVINHVGQKETVEKLLVKENKEKLLEIKIVGSRPVKITKNHPVFCYKNPYKSRKTFNKHIKNIKPSFVKAEDIKLGDFLVIPKIKTTINNKIKINNTDFILNKEMMRFFGYYIAEGSGGNGSSTLSFHSEENDYHTDVINILKNNFACNPNIVNFDRNRTNIVFNKKWLSDLLHELFGRRASNKKIPFDFMFLDNSLIKELLIGLFRGDGTHKHGGKFRLSTTSKTLANQVKYLLVKLNTRPTIQYSERKDHHDEYIVSISGDDRNKLNFDNIKIDKKIKKNHSTINLDDCLISPVRSIKEVDSEDFVYNLQVSGEHTYCISSFAVHNCMPTLEGMAMGKDIIATRYSGPTEYLPENQTFEINTFKEAFDNKWFNGGFNWVEIETVEDTIVEMLRDAYQKHKNSNIINEKNIEIAKLYTWKNTAKKVLNGISKA